MDDSEGMRERVISAWRIAALELGVSVEAPFTLDAEGGPVTYLALVRGFGRAKGTLFADMNDDWRDPFEIATSMGFYASALNPLHYDVFNRQDWIDTLNDWGWAGQEETAPDWYTGEPWTASGETPNSEVGPTNQIGCADG